MKDINKAIYALVYQLIGADEHINHNELRYTRDLAVALELSPLETQKIIANPHAYKFSPPPLEHDRMRILYYLLFGMQIDGNIDPKEENLLYNFGLRIGFNELMLEEMILVMKKYLKTKLPDDALVSIVKKYMN